MTSVSFDGACVGCGLAESYDWSSPFVFAVACLPGHRGGMCRCVAAAYDNVIQRDRQKKRVGGREGQLMSACSCRCKRLRVCVISHEECIKHSDKVKQHLKRLVVTLQPHGKRWENKKDGW